MGKKNPFVYGQVVSGESYLPRQDLESKLSDNIRSGQNTAIQGERRVGKTSLVYNVCSNLKGRHLIFADFLLCSDSAEIANAIGKATLKAASKGAFIDSALKALSRLRPTMSYDPATGNPTFSLSLDSAKSRDCTSIEIALEGIEQLSKKRKIVVLFDEFQAVKKAAPSAKTIAAMRSAIQFHSEIPYIFSGSDRRDMIEIFTSPESPFYKSAQAISVDPIDQKDFWRFMASLFKRGRLQMLDSFSKTASDMGITTPGDIQQICNYAWNATRAVGERKVDDRQAIAAIEDIIKTEKGSFEKISESLSPTQLKLARGIATLGGASIYGIDFQERTGLKVTGTITRAANQLVKMDIIRKRNRNWTIENPFYKIWLSTLD